MLAAEPVHIEALYLMGLSHVMEARSAPETAEASYRASRRYFVRAFNQNATHAPTLFRYAETHFAAPGPMSQTNLDVLVTARNLSPQIGDIAFMTAAALMESNRFDEAESVLRPIAANPHGGPAARRAREMVESAAQQRPSPPPAPE